MDKYVEAFNYVTNSLRVALACLGVEDGEAMECLEVLRELVENNKTSETQEETN